ncbi:hypothetical protein NRIC_31510 [Enterococcus florum]|uniref:Gram-positive pilin subunit D1 N-terminal domain-containing protein n=1 Tax=Enterococcus florum TaxID=2480627 RepID=A0A4P5PB68_9ENTE|nr:SpaH/EbpB family LPXTG-anchored major pilin [Enterococcus florum]GCF95260.1 hypothetical protein NRIC_31510 [Enterococcus florum]
MRKLGKLLAVAALMLTTLGSGVSALAADHDAIQPVSGDLTIHKHWAEDSSQIGDEGDGTELTGADAITNPPVQHVQFNVYKLTPKTAGTDPVVPPSEKDGAVYTKNSSSTELSVAYNGNTYVYTMTKEAGVAKTDANGVVKLTGLKGFYYVEEDLAASQSPKPTIPDGSGGTKEVQIASPVKPFVISVPMTTTTEDSWNTDVHVYPKNQGQTPTKDMDGASKNSVNVGDSVNYDIRVNIPGDIEDYTVYKINDKLDPALTYTASSAKAYVYKDDGAGGWTKVEIPNVGNVNYTVTNPDPTPTTGNENTLTVDFTAAGRDALQAYMDPANGGYTHVGIEFTVTVNEKVKDKPNYTVKNKGEIEFNNGLSSENDKVPTTETETNVGEVIIDKKDQKGNALAGSEFQIAKDNTAAKAGDFIKVKVDANGDITDLVYPGEADYATALDWIIRPGETDASKLGVISGKYYAATFKNLQTHSGVDDARVALKYYVVETLAPDGYNLLGEPVEIDFANENTTTHVVTKEVVNSRGFKLPATGGMGLILITIAGIALIGLAVMVVLPKRRHS